MFSMLISGCGCTHVDDGKDATMDELDVFVARERCERFYFLDTRFCWHVVLLSYRHVELELIDAWTKQKRCLSRTHPPILAGSTRQTEQYASPAEWRSEGYKYRSEF